MPESLTTPLVEAASETFESLAYLFAEPVSGAPDPSDVVEGVVAVSFNGPAHGGLILQLAGGALAPLTSNMLGLDDPPSPQDQRDALGEAANVICGNVLPRVAGATAVFSLGVPTSYPSWDAALEALGPLTAHVRLDVEGAVADIGLVMDATA